MRGTRIVLFAVIFSLCTVAAPVAATPHPFTVHDLVAMDRVSDPQVSPDGATIVFVVRSTDLEANRGRTDLWMVGADGTGLRRLTTHPESDTNPRWAPDNRTVYFLSTRSGRSQVWKIRVEGGEAQQVTDLPLDAGNLLVSPDGARIAFTMKVFADCTTLSCTTERLEQRESRKETGRVFDRLFIRHWDTWEDGRRFHLFTMPAAGGKPVDVMRGMDADTPSQPFGGPEEITFGPKGSLLVFTAKDVGRKEAWSTDYDLYLVPVDGSSPPACLTTDNPAWDSTPAFSPDGKRLAWLAMSRPGYESDRLRVMVRDWPEGTPREVAPAWDRSPHSLAWSADGTALYAVADDLGQRALFRLDARSGQVKKPVARGSVGSISVAPGRVVYARDDLQSPADLFSIRGDGAGERRLTSFNAERLASIQMGAAEPFTFEGWGGETVHGYVVKPAAFDPAKKYPVAFLIHGGPQGSFGNHFHYRWNPQAYAGAGYAAVMVDFHGSTGYGQAFTDSIRGDWGGKPLEDLQKGLAAALKQYPWMDGDRVSALGASFGAYMINWIAGRWPDRFRCLVSHDGNLDEHAAYFTTEELWFPEWDHEGTPWDNPEGYQKHNPVNLVGNWKTPILVIHGARDYRVVDTAGIATFTAAQRRGVPSKLLYFPDESHWVLKPVNSIQWHETVLAWLDRWTR